MSEPVQVGMCAKRRYLQPAVAEQADEHLASVGMTWSRTLRVHTTPVAKARPRFAAGHAYTPTKTRHQEWEIRQAWMARHGDRPAMGPLRVEVIALLQMPKAVPKRDRATVLPMKRPDADNLAKTVLDGLKGVAWRDDAQIVDLRVRKAYVASGAAPGWLIKLRDLTLPLEEESA
ncbi:MAG: RusA family crossover junction endodeoxyribonuclease [Candidatus Dormibacteraceae bacterium]